MNRALFFDIDGTLLSVNQSFVHKIIEQVLNQLNLPQPDIHQISFAGRTDRAIFSELLTREGAHHFNHFRDSYIRKLLDGLEEHHITVFSGVPKALAILSQSSPYQLGLLTGNFKQVGWHKVKQAGLDHYFSFGAFGCSDLDRADLVQRACQQLLNNPTSSISEASQIMIIGDTPNDVRCGKLAGAQTIAVTTGIYNEDELSSAKPDYLIESLEQLPNLLLHLA
ncbi:MAG: HAD family hydrolase [Bacteroidota bacterium]